MPDLLAQICWGIGGLVLGAVILVVIDGMRF